MAQVSLKDIEDGTQSALMLHGAGSFAAAEVARAVARAEAMGNRAFGLALVEGYCAGLLSGQVKGDVVPVVETVRSACVTVDAGGGFAHPAFAYGLPVALDAARQAGIATLAVARGQGAGALGYFTEQVAAAGLIGLGFADTPPEGGAGGGGGVAFSVPDGRGGIAVHVGPSPAGAEPLAEPGPVARILAAAMTGLPPSDAAAGQAGEPGQFYLILDPSVSAGFSERLVAALARDGAMEVPGRAAPGPEAVEVPDALWSAVGALGQ